jgi:23S rRNA pseudouridine1911/1915/1917 synthase
MHDHERRFQFVADRGDARLRLDRILVRRVTAVSRLSRTLARQWIESGAVHVNDRPALRPSARVAGGDRVSVALPPSTIFRAEPAAEPIPIDLLYRDDGIAIVNKPAGMVVHPSYKQLEGTLLSGILWQFRGEPDLQPGIVTRLDKDTSGLVLVALRPEVHAILQRDARAGRIEKTYLAVVRGSPRPASGRILFPLARDPEDRRRMTVTPEGAPSETRYEVVRQLRPGAGGESLVRCELVTGRTHQIRAHLAAAGWPIVGDRTYGRPDPRIARQALHASRLALPHPLTRLRLDIESSLPSDIQALFSS